MIYLTQAQDGPQYAAAYATREIFLTTYDADFLAECPEAGQAYVEAADYAEANPGTPAYLGDGDTLIVLEVIT